MSTLWPEECTHLEHVPQEFISAVEHATMVLSWYENRPKEEIPPRWMWLFDEELEAWFKRVDEERKAKSSPKGTDSSTPMVQNELTKGMR